MTIELTDLELEIMQHLAYNEYIRQCYLARVEEREVPLEYYTILQKLKGDE